jgi:hypothetical protein
MRGGQALEAFKLQGEEDLNQLKHWIEQGHGKSGLPIEGQEIRANEKAAVGPDMGIGQ